eukprot:GHVN01020779.1.p3 GENE.GHVN01020779.1~~GHVN01020779.1.p3  ORF type:complete len:221 (-),score=23.34 GHVN01020779.1:82-744(-)
MYPAGDQSQLSSMAVEAVAVGMAAVVAVLGSNKPTLHPYAPTATTYAAAYDPWLLSLHLRQYQQEQLTRYQQEQLNGLRFEASSAASTAVPSKLAANSSAYPTTSNASFGSYPSSVPNSPIRPTHLLSGPRACIPSPVLSNQSNIPTGPASRNTPANICTHVPPNSNIPSQKIHPYICAHTRSNIHHANTPRYGGGGVGGGSGRSVPYYAQHLNPLPFVR